MFKSYLMSSASSLVIIIMTRDYDAERPFAPITMSYTKGIGDA